MSIILAINGIAETYPAKSISPRYSHTEPVPDQEHQNPHSSLDHSTLTAQTAYQQHSIEQPRQKLVVLAQDLMNSPVLSLPSDSRLLDAWNIMLDKDVHHIPITSLHGTLVGMVSYRDLLHHVPELITAADTQDASRKSVAEVMTSRVISATPTTEIREIARVMLEERIHAVPLIDHNRRLVGILSTRDLVRGIATHGPLELWT